MGKPYEPSNAQWSCLGRVRNRSNVGITNSQATALEKRGFVVWTPSRGPFGGEWVLTPAGETLCAARLARFGRLVV